MSTTCSDTVSAAQARHDRAVARTLEWADQAAERGQHATALEWLQTVEAIGDELSGEYQSKRNRWRRALMADRAAHPAGSARRPMRQAAR
jgi:hypothetical protein